MSMKENFLKEVKIGDYVELMIGSKEITGLVIALDMETVRIRRKEGKEPVFSLEAISYYEVGKDEIESTDPNLYDTSIISGNSSVATPVASSEIDSKSLPVVSKSVNKEDTTTLEKNEESMIIKVERIIDVLNKSGCTFFLDMMPPTIKNYKDVAKMVTMDSELRKNILSISNSIEYAIIQAHELSPADYKIQENIGKIKRLTRNYPASKDPYNLLGAVYFRCKCESLALEAFENGSDNESAFALAANMHNADKMLMFAARHFILDKTTNAYIYKYLLVKMLEEDDFSLCLKITLKSLTNDKLTAYHAILRAILMLCEVEYNSMLDFDISEATLEDLLNLLKNKKIGNRANMVNYLPKEKIEIITQKRLEGTKSLEDCPIFAAAEQARMEEKNLIKAEKLYKQAIERNEKPGSSVANLYHIFMQQRRFKECALYLGRYGSRYMREENYNNLKTQFLASSPVSMAAEIARYEQADTNPRDSIDYFVLAQKADIEEKDLQKSIKYYKKAIETNTRLTAAIPNLAMLYSRLEMYQEALDLLNQKGRTVMERYTYLNLKQSVLIKAKNKSYRNEIIETFDQLIMMNTSLEKKTEISSSKAWLLAQVGLYEDAIETYNICLINCSNKSYSPLKKDRQKMFVLRGLCYVYIHLNDIDKAREYAKQILLIDKNNEYAKSIMSGDITGDTEFGDENIGGVIHINEYIQHKLDELNLDSEIKVKDMVEDGKFTGTQEKAASILDSMMNNRSANEEAKSNQYLAGAKLIDQILCRDEEIDSNRFNEQRYLIYIAEGTCSYANSRLYRTELANNLDVARYFYIQPMTIFNDSEKFKPIWAVATIRYLQTFFDPVEVIRKEGNTLYQKCKDYNSCIEIIKIIMQNPIRTDVAYFTVGIIELLASNIKIKKNVLQLINTNAFQGKILDVLANIINSEVPDISTVNDLEKVWDEATTRYYARRKTFLRMISETIESLFAIGQLQDNLLKLENNQFTKLLNSTDQETIKELYEIFRIIVRYNEIAEFDYKAETLKRADDFRKRLQERITEYPTYLSYEKLLPLLEQIQAKIFKESSSLYGNSEPQLTVSLSGDSSVEEEVRIVRVPIAFTNKVNAQNADNVQISITGEGVENINDTQLSRGLLVGDGRAKEEMVTFRFSQNVLEEKVFSIVISINYQYKKNMTETVETSHEFVLSVPLYSSSKFIPIDNRFEPHKNGSEVKDVTMFYGRDKDIENILSQISDNKGRILQGRCLAIYGQTRTGKSSLLYHLEKKLRENDTERLIIVNIGSIGEENLVKDDITEFLYTLLDGLKSEITLNHPDLVSVLKNCGITLDADRLLEDPSRSQLFFNSEFKKVCRCLQTQSKGYNIIVMIDEFTYIYDWIRSGIMTDRIMKFWKAFIQNNGIFAIIIGQDHMMSFVSEKQFTNDFGSTDLWRITYLSEEDAKRLMYEPILLKNENGEMVNRYKEGALDRLYELTSGSAFLIMNLCAGLVDYLNEVHSVYITRAHIDDYLRKNLATFEEARFFEPQYDDKSEVKSDKAIIRNKKMLRRIAQLSNKKEWTPLQSLIETDEDKKTIESLRQRDVIIVNGDRCKIKVALYKEWILEKYGLGGSV